MFYPHTLHRLKAAFAVRYPKAVPTEIRDDIRLENYLLWMIEEIEKMEERDYIKAGRWLGWILCMAEERLRLWNNDTSRDFVRIDVQNGCDRPPDGDL